MKKKLLITVIALVCSVCCIAMLFAGCKDNKPGTREYDISEIIYSDGSDGCYKYQLNFSTPKSTYIEKSTYLTLSTPDTYRSYDFFIKDNFRTADYTLNNIRLKVTSEQACTKTFTVLPAGVSHSDSCNGVYQQTVSFAAGETKDIVIAINKGMDDFSLFKTGLTYILFHPLIEETNEWAGGFIVEGIKYKTDSSNWREVISISEIKFTITKK